MPNSLATTNGTLIGRRILETLLEEFSFLRLITADFSPEAALWGQPIKIHLPAAFTAGDYTVENGYAQLDASQTEATLTINKHKHVTYGFNEWERTSTNINLVERFARNGAHALGAAMMGDLMALLILAKFSHRTPILASAFGRKSLLGVDKTLTGRKVPNVGRFAVMNSDYYESLADDEQVIANPGSPSDAVRSGVIGDVHGFRVERYAQLPANSINLAGFAGTAEGLVIAARVPQMPDPREIQGKIEIVTEPNTGLSLQVRSWYDMQKGVEYRTYTLMYGVAAGNAECIELLADAGE